MTRYATTTGHHVMRRFGWDCHGLPVEYEIDKKLGECQGLRAIRPGLATVLCAPGWDCNGLPNRRLKRGWLSVSRG